MSDAVMRDSVRVVWCPNSRAFFAFEDGDFTINATLWRATRADRYEELGRMLHFARTRDPDAMPVALDVSAEPLNERELRLIAEAGVNRAKAKLDPAELALLKAHFAGGGE